MQRQEEKQKESEVLASFDAVWKKPFGQLVAEVCERNPDALHQFGARLRKGVDCDLSEMKKTFERLEKQNAGMVIPEKKYLMALYEHNQERNNNLAGSLHHEENFLKDMILTFTVLYNPQDYLEFFTHLRLHVTPLTDEDFYFRFLNCTQADMWSFHALVDYTYIGDHFQERANLVVDSNANLLYQIGLMHDLKRYLWQHHREEHQHEIRFMPSMRPRSLDESHVLDSPLPHYRRAATLGSEQALASLARLHAIGSYGLEKDPEFAIELYRLLLQRNAFGSLPFDSEDPRLLFYSTLTSGMNTAGVSEFLKQAPLKGMSLVEAAWIMRMNYADPNLENTLRKFEEFAIKNPNDLFDKLLDEDVNSMARLKVCLKPDVYELVLNRKKNQTYLSAKALGDKLPPEVHRHIFSFLTGNQEYVETIGQQTALLKPPVGLEVKLPDIRKLFSANLRLFKVAEKEFLANNRHTDPRVQEAYDRSCGLIPYDKSAVNPWRKRF